MALDLVRNLIGISVVAIVFLCGGALGSYGQQEPPSGRSEDAEFRQLEPALKFLRTRNARTYAITAPNGIEGGGHFAVFTRQDDFLKELRARVLPLIH